MTSLIAKLNHILGFQDWENLRREAGELWLTWLERFGPEPDHWERFDEPVSVLRAADIDALRELFSEIEAGSRSIRVIEKETLKVVDVPSDFWTGKVYQWVIHRGPPGAIGERGAEWLLYDPQISDAKPQQRSRRGRPPKPLHDKEKLIARLREIRKNAPKQKWEHAIEQLSYEAGVSRNQARAAANLLKSRENKLPKVPS